MASLSTVALVVLGVTAAVLIVGWLGFQVEPRGFAPPSDRARDLGTIGLPSDVPGPVQRYYENISADGVPRAETAVVWGKARLNINGLWMPARFKVYYRPGESFYQYIEVTWFNIPIVKAHDTYINGEGVMRIEGLVNSRESGPRISQGENMAMWAGATSTPSLFTSPKVRWEVVDERSARMTFPFNSGEDSLLFNFNPDSGLVSEIVGQRYKGTEASDKTPWKVEFAEWEAHQGVMIPTRYSVTWVEDGEPWSFWSVQGIEYNVDVSEYLPAS